MGLGLPDIFTGMGTVFDALGNFQKNWAENQALQKFYKNQDITLGKPDDAQPWNTSYEQLKQGVLGGLTAAHLGGEADLKDQYRLDLDAITKMANLQRGLSDTKAETLRGVMGQTNKGLTDYYQGRMDRGLGMLEGYGEQAARDIKEQYRRAGAEQQQSLVDRGLSNSTVANSVAQGNTRETADSLARHWENVAGQKANAYNQYSADLGGIMGQNAANAVNLESTLAAEKQRADFGVYSDPTMAMMQQREAINAMNRQAAGSLVDAYGNIEGQKLAYQGQQQFPFAQSNFFADTAPSLVNYGNFRASMKAADYEEPTTMFSWLGGAGGGAGIGAGAGFLGALAFPPLLGMAPVTMTGAALTGLAGGAIGGTAGALGSRGGKR